VSWCVLASLRVNALQLLAAHRRRRVSWWLVLLLQRYPQLLLHLLRLLRQWLPRLLRFRPHRFAV
jgi:hypothetical protein